jgi:hypothetical protein
VLQSCGRDGNVWECPQTCPKEPLRFGPVRPIVARCEVRYTGRLTAVLPESIRLLRWITGQVIDSEGGFPRWTS